MRTSLQRKIHFEKTQKSWLVPSSCILEKHDLIFLKVEAHCYGFVNIITPEKLQSTDKPSISGSKKLHLLVEKRNSLVSGDQAGDAGSLFGKGSSKDKKKKATTKSL